MNILKQAQRIVQAWNEMPSSIEKTYEICLKYSEALDIVKEHKDIESKKIWDNAIRELLSLHKFAMEPIIKEQKRIAHKKAQAKYRKEKLGQIPRDPNAVPLTKAQQNKRYAATDNGKAAIKKAHAKYYIRKLQRKRQAVKSRWS